jgi:hypothetical protein
LLIEVELDRAFKPMVNAAAGIGWRVLFHACKGVFAVTGAPEPAGLHAQQTDEMFR